MSEDEDYSPPDLKAYLQEDGKLYTMMQVVEMSRQQGRLCCNVPFSIEETHDENNTICSSFGLGLCWVVYTLFGILGI